MELIFPGPLITIIHRVFKYHNNTHLQKTFTFTQSNGFLHQKIKNPNEDCDVIQDAITHKMPSSWESALEEFIKEIDFKGQFEGDREYV